MRCSAFRYAFSRFSGWRAPRSAQARPAKLKASPLGQREGGGEGVNIFVVKLLAVLKVVKTAYSLITKASSPAEEKEEEEEGKTSL